MCYWNMLFLLNHNNGDMELVWSNHLFRETGPWTPKTGACCVFLPLHAPVFGVSLFALR